MAVHMRNVIATLAGLVCVCPSSSKLELKIVFYMLLLSDCSGFRSVKQLADPAQVRFPFKAPRLIIVF